MCLYSGVRVDGDDEYVWTVGEIGRMCGTRGLSIGMGIGMRIGMGIGIGIGIWIGIGIGIRIGVGMWRGERHGCRQRGAGVLDRDVDIDR